MRRRQKRRSSAARFRRTSRKRKEAFRLAVVGVAIGVSIGSAIIFRPDLAGFLSPNSLAERAEKIVGNEPSSNLGCFYPTVVDGDTIRCGNQRIRLSSIDAPEMPGHCRPGRACTTGDPYASKSNLQSLTRFKQVDCRQVDVDSYGRFVALCSADGPDLSCAQVEGRFAVRRYRALTC